ncbi:MAG: hypothetical protein ACOX8S_00210 [Christensenellales bacterium]|jgi:hypothetical protein
MNNENSNTNNNINNNININIIEKSKRASDLFPRRITVFCGHYGSGKTEISVHTALELKKSHEKVALVDLDIVNPYFRSAEQRELVEGAGVRLLAPTFALTTIDIPGLPAEIQSVFDAPNEKVIFDVGGDDTGAVALGRYKPYFDKSDFEMLFVINTLRPFSSSVESIVDLYGRIVSRARMKASALINNTNFGAQTTPQDVINGQKIVEEASAALGIPLRAVTAQPEIMDRLPREMQEIGYPITTRMRPEWM